MTETQERRKEDRFVMTKVCETKHEGIKEAEEKREKNIDILFKKIDRIFNTLLILLGALVTNLLYMVLGKH